MSVKIDFFESIAREIDGKFRRINHLLSKANQKSGEYHEEILRESFRNFLPKRFSVKTGYIFYDNDHHSKQIDILIIDENCPFAYLFQEKDFVIVRPEAVVAMIEVKSVLKENELDEAFDNILVAKKVKYKALGHYGHIYGAVFGFSSNKIINNSLLDKWFRSKLAKYKDEVYSLWPDSIFFFEHGLFLQLDTRKMQPEVDTREYYFKIFKQGASIDRAFQLSLLIATLIANCELSSRSQGGTTLLSPLKSTSMIDWHDASYSFDVFRPGEGLKRLN